MAEMPKAPPFAAACANGVFAIPRALVSQNKRRFKQDGYDLDLCYLHPRVVVMGEFATLRELKCVFVDLFVGWNDKMKRQR